MPIYQWLFFDADGTLFDFERAEENALSRSFQRIGVKFGPDHLAVYRQINHALWKQFENGLLTPETLNSRRFELLFAEIGIQGSPSDFGAFYASALGTCADLIDGACEVLNALRPHHHIAILTNGLRDVQRARLDRSPIREHISETIISEEIGAAKPASRFFDIAFSRTGNPAKNAVLMIGDNWTSDIRGAADYGLDTCWFNPTDRPRPDANLVTWEITSLRQLPELLKSR